MSSPVATAIPVIDYQSEGSANGRIGAIKELGRGYEHPEDSAFSCAKVGEL